MQRLALNVCRQGVSASRAQARRLAMARTIPTDLEQQFGRRKLEVDSEAKGEEFFNDLPVVPPVNAGTKENPILVPSGFDMRAIGFEDPATHQMCWFNMHAGATYFVPEIGLHFKLYYPGDGKMN